MAASLVKARPNEIVLPDCDGDSRALRLHRVAEDHFLVSVDTDKRTYMLSLDRTQVAELAAGAARLLA